MVKVRNRYKSVYYYVNKASNSYVIKNILISMLQYTINLLKNVVFIKYKINPTKLLSY